MTRAPRYATSICFSVVLLIIEAALLAHEHVTGGVRSHHLLDRPDLPAISNWFGLIVMPLLGWLLGSRLHRSAALSIRPVLPIAIWTGLACALLYGAAMATAFTLGAANLSSGLFYGLLVLAAAFPIYRIEFIAGFVVGMAFTFGAVLPTVVAAVLALVSFVARFVFRTCMSAIRPTARPSGNA